MKGYGVCDWLCMYLIGDNYLQVDFKLSLRAPCTELYLLPTQKNLT